MKQLTLLCALVRRWNGTVQLVSASDCDVLETRHVANSLTLVPLLVQLRPSSVIDIGSGGGFPGLVVALATGIHVHLVESDRRKAEFLREAARQLEASVTVHAMHTSMVAITADLVTARAVGPLSVLWPTAAPLLNRSGRALFLKGAAAAQELRQAGLAGLLWSGPDGAVVEVRK